MSLADSAEPIVCLQQGQQDMAGTDMGCAAPTTTLPREQADTARPDPIHLMLKTAAAEAGSKSCVSSSTTSNIRLICRSLENIIN
jgi:hypothetical protein